MQSVEGKLLEGIPQRNQDNYIEDTFRWFQQMGLTVNGMPEESIKVIDRLSNGIVKEANGNRCEWGMYIGPSVILLDVYEKQLAESDPRFRIRVYERLQMEGKFTEGAGILLYDIDGINAITLTPENSMYRFISFSTADGLEIFVDQGGRFITNTTRGKQMYYPKDQG